MLRYGCSPQVAAKRSMAGRWCCTMRSEALLSSPDLEIIRILKSADHVGLLTIPTSLLI